MDVMIFNDDDLEAAAKACRGKTFDSDREALVTAFSAAEASLMARGAAQFEMRRGPGDTATTFKTYPVIVIQPSQTTEATQ